MNNKFKELANKATDLCVAEGKPTPWLWEETYAQLIIRECLIVLNRPNGVSNSDVNKIHGDILNHFNITNSIKDGRKMK
jgi:hypothetical protein